MGSKTALLNGELGELVLERARQADGFVDLFAGSGAVSHYVAERVNVPVRSVDLQALTVPLALSVTGRERAIEDISSFQHWVKLARDAVETGPAYESIAWASRKPSKTSVLESRRLARRLGSAENFIMASYGGHYFSPAQAAAMDQLWATRPTEPVSRILAEACIVRAASRCAAAPGHTAQPFQPTRSLLPFIEDAWNVDVFNECEKQLRSLAPRHALSSGEAFTQSASDYVESSVTERDLVFCDPPYSAAQYSRFYHVLEGIARGGFDDVSGAGRAPSRGNRPNSAFSRVGGARVAFTDLFESLARKKVTIILTFPAGTTSLGVTGADVTELAKQHFKPTQSLIAHVHSTLGGSSTDGDSSGRSARRALNEMVLVLEPK